MLVSSSPTEQRPTPTSDTASTSKGLLGLPLVNRLPTALDLDKQDLTDAGKNLTSIYRGLRDVLRTAANGLPAGEASKGAATEQR